MSQLVRERIDGSLYHRIPSATVDTVGEVCRERAIKARCCPRDGGRPSEAGLQEQASNSRKLRWSRAIVVSVTGKGVINHVM